MERNMNLLNYEEVQFPGLGLKFDIDPVAFRIGNFEVYWYGILIAAALVLCIALAIKQAKKYNFPDTLIYDTMLVTIPCAIASDMICENFPGFGTVALSFLFPSRYTL